MPAQGSAHVVRFGSFEMDFESGELRKSGHRVALPHQALQLLAMLVEQPGELVTRERLQARLWPNGTVVEFDHGINSSIRRLRAALNDSAEQPRYIETLAKRGYRFIFPCEAAAAIPRPADLSIPSPERKYDRNDSRSRSGLRKWRWAAVAAVVLAILLGGSRLYIRYSHASPITSIAVLPLVNISRESNAEYLSDGITQEIINTLCSAPRLKVIARSSAFRFKGKEIDPQTAGHTLGVGAVLTGTLMRHADTVTIQADLIRVADGSELWGEQFHRSLSDMQGVQGEIAREIAHKLRLRLTSDEEERLTKRYTENNKAYELYLKGVRVRLLSTNLESINYLQQAIAIDPRFALAHVELARGHCDLAVSRQVAAVEGFEKAKAAAIKALELDEHLGEAHVQLAIALQFGWDWAGAEREFKRGLELNTNSAHQPYSVYLTQVGRTQEGVVEARRAAQLDPLSADTHNRIAWVYYLARDYDHALEEERTAAANGGPSVTLPFILEQKKMYDEAIAEFKKLGDSAGILGHLGHVYAVSGRASEALAILRELQTRARKEQVGAYEVAFIYAALGKTNEAFEWLDKAYRQYDAGLTYLKVDPNLDPLRSDPRFERLLKRLGFPL
jgi:TolB-like protein/DNA-binding winged helix-turn-helix (wHTH) protein